MKRQFLSAAVLGIAQFVSGCFDTADDAETNASVLSFAAVMENRSGMTASKSMPRLKARRLGPDERRVMVFVVPGDALVEVDGRPAFRRNGLIELVGKVGDVRKLRVFKGARSTGEKTITIGDLAATPSLVDLNEVIPVAAATGKKKTKPLVFSDIDE